MVRDRAIALFCEYSALFDSAKPLDRESHAMSKAGAGVDVAPITGPDVLGIAQGDIAAFKKLHDAEHRRGRPHEARCPHLQVATQERTDRDRLLRLKNGNGRRR